MSRPLGDVGGLRIAHLIETDGPGGAERVVAHLAMTLQEAGASNVVFLPADREGWLGRELEGSGVATEYFRLDRPLSPSFARWMEAAFRRHRVVVAHSHEFGMAVYAAWACWRAGIPHVMTMHGSRYYAERLRRRLALRAAVTVGGRMVAVSAPLARQISRDLWVRPSRIATLANGIPYVAPERTTLREELRLGHDDRLLVAVGNLYPVKGHRHLVDALAALVPRHPTLHLAIAGRGELHGALSAQAESKGLGDRLHLLGLRSDIPAILAAADVFVLPSLSEGLPLALLEAMFAGRPIVASNVGEVSVALAHGDAGVLVQPGDRAALAVAVDGILRDPSEAQRLGDRAALRARAEYDVYEMARRYLGIYEHLRESRPTRPAIAYATSPLGPAPAPARSEHE